MQVKIDGIDNGYTLTYWNGDRYATVFSGNWEETAAKAKSLIHTAVTTAEPKSRKPQ